jgi:hypothetical protein
MAKYHKWGWEPPKEHIFSESLGVRRRVIVLMHPNVPCTIDCEESRDARCSMLTMVLILEKSAHAALGVVAHALLAET